MIRRQRVRILSRVSITAFLLLLLAMWTATNAVAQTDDDRVAADVGDSQEGRGQTDDAQPAVRTLDEMLKVALEHNPDIRAARAEVSVAEANLDRTRLTLVKELTAFRDRRLTLKTSLTAAVEELAFVERLAAQGFTTESNVTAAREKVDALQLQFREVATELPFLLGAPFEDGNEQAPASEAERQTDDSTGKPDDAEPTMPTLDQMLRIGMQHNPDVRAARGEVALAEANLDRTRLTVVKELTAYRDRWHSAKAELSAAEQELANIEEAYEQGAFPISMVNDARQKVSAVQLKLREVEAELPFLMGASLEDENEQTATSEVESQTALLKDKAIPLAEQILTLSMQSYREGNGDLERCLKWASCLMQLQRDVADSDAERREALEDHLELLQDMREIARAAYTTGNRPYEDVLAAEFAIVEAEAMLERSGAG
jgi:outer membrane protein TolC